MTLEQAKQWFKLASIELEKQKDVLTELDAKIGDADHGTNISRGFKEVVKAIDEKDPKNIGELFKSSAMVMMSKVGGASGMLYTAFFLKASAAIGDKDNITKEDFIDALEKGVNGIIDRGRAQLGDKTMIDVWLPALDTFRKQTNESKSLKEASVIVSKEAFENSLKTKDIIAKKGRASYLGERSIGHQDPGSLSTAIILESLSKTLS